MAIGRSGLRLHRSIFPASHRVEGAIVRKCRLIWTVRVYTSWTSGKPYDSPKAGRNSPSAIGRTAGDDLHRGRHHHGHRKIPGLCGSAGNCRGGRDGRISLSGNTAMAGGPGPARRGNPGVRCHLAGYAPTSELSHVSRVLARQAGAASTPAPAGVRPPGFPGGDLDPSQLGPGGRRYHHRGKGPGS